MNAAEIERQTSIAAFQIIEAMGSYYVWENDAGDTMTIRGVVASIANNDTALINSVGIESSLFYCLPQPTLPKKFETITQPGGQRRVIQSVHEIVANNKTVALKMVLSK